MKTFLSVFRDGECIADKVEYGNSFIKRFSGLMGRKNINKNEGFYLIPCRSIHTFGMRFPIDILFLSEDKIVLNIEKSLKPGRLRTGSKKARSVLELSSDKVSECNIKTGDKIIFD